MKGIPLTYVYVNLREGAQFNDDFDAVNPNRTVPVLKVTSSGTSESTTIRQSVAILEYLEEAFPNCLPLLPSVSDLSGRAKIRELVQVICGDVQPPTNQRILKRVKQYSGTEGMESWAKSIMGDGLAAFEKLVEPCVGPYCHHDALSLADVVLVPAVENATRYGVDLAQLPTIARLYQTLSQLEGFKAGNWSRQGDTPEDEKSA